MGLQFTTYEYLPPLLTLRSLFIVSHKSYLSTICLAEKYKDKLYNVCYNPTSDRTHEYLSRKLIDISFEFNWKKNSGTLVGL
jgi:predicted acetyltransferase